MLSTTRAIGDLCHNAQRGKWQVSRGTGSEPRWCGDGQEIFDIGPTRMLMTVPSVPSTAKAQLDAQASYRLTGRPGLSAIVSLLNLNNEVFGYYQGSERYPVQREYYGITVSFGFRWTYSKAE
jgi:hypothetical protein